MRSSYYFWTYSLWPTCQTHNGLHLYDCGANDMKWQENTKSHDVDEDDGDDVEDADEEDGVQTIVVVSRVHGTHIEMNA